MFRTNHHLATAGVLASLLVLGLSIHNLTAQERATGKQRQPAGEAARSGRGAGAQAEGREGARGARGEAAAPRGAAAGEHAESATGGQAGPITTKDISLEQAHAVLHAAVAKSGEIGKKMDIAVVDAGGNLKAFARMDGAWLGSIDI